MNGKNPRSTTYRPRLSTVAAFALAAVALPGVAEDRSSSTTDVAVLSAGLSDFTFDLHRRLAKGNEDMIWSPFGAAMTLGMIRCGSAGETDAGIARALRCPMDVGSFHAAFHALRDGVGESDRKSVV